MTFYCCLTPNADVRCMCKRILTEGGEHAVLDLIGGTFSGQLFDAPRIQAMTPFIRTDRCAVSPQIHIRL